MSFDVLFNVLCDISYNVSWDVYLYLQMKSKLQMQYYMKNKNTLSTNCSEKIYIIKCYNTKQCDKAKRLQMFASLLLSLIPYSVSPSSKSTYCPSLKVTLFLSHPSLSCSSPISTLYRTSGPQTNPIWPHLPPTPVTLARKASENCGQTTRTLLDRNPCCVSCQGPQHAVMNRLQRGHVKYP